MALEVISIFGDQRAHVRQKEEKGNESDVVGFLSISFFFFPLTHRHNAGNTHLA